MTTPINWKLLGLVLFVVMLVIAFAAWRLASHATGLLAGVRDMQDLPFDAQRCNRIAADVEQKTLVADADGVIVLPASLAPATKDGKVYLTRREGATYLLLLTWRGRGTDMKGYLYTRALVTAPGTILIRVPRPRVRPPTVDEEIIVSARVTPNWYSVRGQNTG